MTWHLLDMKTQTVATYFSHVSLLNEWWKESFLEMNVRQKKLVLDARKTSNAFVPVKVTNEPAEVAINFKYICTLIDNKLSFSDKTDLVYKKKLKKKKSNACTSCAS